MRFICNRYLRVKKCLTGAFVKAAAITMTFVMTVGAGGTVLAAGENNAGAQKELVVWYTNSSLTKYLEEMSAEYSKESNTSIVLEQVSQIDYIENINQAVLSSNSKSSGPDLFIAENSELEKLYLAGLCKENEDKDYNERNYPATTLESFTYKNKLLAYPLYFETSYLLYNKKYVDKVPATIDEILDFAESFEAGENVSAIFKWNVSDILCNYFFVGQYFDNNAIGTGKYYLDSDKLTESLQYYQRLNQYFAIDQETATYDNVFNEFLDERIVFTIAKTDKLSELINIEDINVEEKKSENTASVDNTAKKEQGSSAAKENKKDEKTEDNASGGEAASTDSEENSEAGEEKKEVNSNIKDISAGIERLLTGIDENIIIEIVSEGEENGPQPEEDENTVNFGIAELPDLTKELKARGLAVNYGIYVNGYTQYEDEAEKLAKYLSFTRAHKLFEKSGKLSSRNNIDYNNENIANVLKQYAKDATTPKVMEKGDFWLDLEIAFSNIWNGKEVEEILKTLE